jgi:hypothetical protein
VFASSGFEVATCVGGNVPAHVLAAVLSFVICNAVLCRGLWQVLPLCQTPTLVSTTHVCVHYAKLLLSFRLQILCCE